MKTQIFSIILFLAVFAGTNSFASGNEITGTTETAFGAYTISPSPNYVVIDNVAYKSWDLNYSNSDKKFTLFYQTGVEGQCCIMVRSDNFEIKYEKGTKGFGAKLVDAENRTVKKREVLKQISAEKLEMQRVLTNKVKSEAEYLGLVACFMPMLFKS